MVCRLPASLHISLRRVVETDPSDYPRIYRLDYTHFVSIPLASPTAQASFKTLRDEILAEPTAAGAGIEDSIFVDERKLHLTVAMLKLYTFEKRQKAAQVQPPSNFTRA